MAAASGSSATMYHVFKWNARRIALTLVTKKPLSRWDDCEVSAVWETRAAANAWAKQHIGLTESGRQSYKVLECEGADCGLGSCPGRAYWRSVQAEIAAA